MEAGGLSFLLLLVPSRACSSQEAVAVWFVFSLCFLSLPCTEGRPNSTGLPRHKNNFLNIHPKVHHSEGTVNSNSFSFMITSSVRPPQIHSYMSTSSCNVDVQWHHCEGLAPVQAVIVCGVQATDPGKPVWVPAPRQKTARPSAQAGRQRIGSVTIDIRYSRWHHPSLRHLSILPLQIWVVKPPLKYWMSAGEQCPSSSS